MISQKVEKRVIPAKAWKARLRGNDNKKGYWTFYEAVNFDDLAKSQKSDGRVKKLQMQAEPVEVPLAKIPSPFVLPT